MANTSEKKRSKQADETYTLYRNIIIGLTIFYVVFKFLLKWSEVNTKAILALGFFCVLNMYCFNTIVDCTKRGLPFE
jgi:hypothetical protein